MNPNKLLIANRGLVALDVLAAAKQCGLTTLLLSSPEDISSLPVKWADKVLRFSSTRPRGTYLDGDTILEIAQREDAGLIHPGYGFLAEQAEFASRCRSLGIRFAGPSVEVLSHCMHKVNLRETAQRLGLETVPALGVHHSSLEAEKSLKGQHQPVLIKPVSGSSGTSIRVTHDRRAAQERIATLLAREEIAQQGVLVEPYLAQARHIEIPFLRDSQGNLVVFPEIESTIQRRFQKILQESPAVTLSENQRLAMQGAVQRLAGELRYQGFGSVEFLLDGERPLLLELNTSLQINHVIPSWHWGRSVLEQQIRIALGNELPLTGTSIIRPRHHLVLCALMAERPEENFQPASGRLSRWQAYPTSQDLVQTYLNTGDEVSSQYAPFIARLMSAGEDRPDALSRMCGSLERLELGGIDSNRLFLLDLIRFPAYQGNRISIHFLEEHPRLVQDPDAQTLEKAAALLAAQFHLQNRRKNFQAELERMPQPGLLRRLFDRMRG